jgi:hypothetical protein
MPSTMAMPKMEAKQLWNLQFSNFQLKQVSTVKARVFILLYLPSHGSRLFGLRIQITRAQVCWRVLIRPSKLRIVCSKFTRLDYMQTQQQYCTCTYTKTAAGTVAALNAEIVISQQLSRASTNLTIDKYNLMLCCHTTTMAAGNYVRESRSRTSCS